MTAGPPTEPPILTADEIQPIRDDGASWVSEALLARLLNSHEALRARLRDAEETLRAADEFLAGIWSFGEAPRRSRPTGLGDASRVIRAYFERHADPQEPA